MSTNKATCPVGFRKIERFWINTNEFCANKFWFGKAITPLYSFKEPFQEKTWKDITRVGFADRNYRLVSKIEICFDNFE